MFPEKKTLAWHHVSFNSEDQERMKGDREGIPYTHPVP